MSDAINLELRRRLAALKDEARKNEDAWRRSKQRELDLLEAAGLAELLERLTGGLRASYSLAAATLVLADPEHEVRHLLLGRGRRPDGFANVRFVDSAAECLPPAAARTGRPWLGAYNRNAHEALFPATVELESVALLPLVRRQRLVGALNLGSAERERFHRGLATDFLGHLAVIAAFSLENAINRERLVRSGHTDVLTGWHNRRYLESRLKEELARSRRESRPLACLMIDVDHFKRINDEHGHLAGDEVLRAVAARIDAQVRASDVAARYGGEEFIVLAPGTGLDAGLALGERIRKAVEAAPFELAPGGTRLPVTVSIGVAEHPAAGGDSLESAAERLVAAADSGLYRAKSAGRNAVCPAGPSGRRPNPLERLG